MASSILSSWSTRPTFSAQGAGPAAVVTPIMSVANSGHGGGGIDTGTKVAMVVVPILFFLVVLGFCLVARKSDPEAPILPVRNCISSSSYEKRQSVERWREGVPYMSQDGRLSLVQPIHPIPPPSPISRQASVSSISGSTIVGLPCENPYLPQPFHSLRPPPAAYRADHPYTLGGIP